MHLRSGTVVHLQYRRVTTSHDEQGWGPHRRQVVAGEIGTTTAGDDSEDLSRPGCGRDQGSRGPGRGSEDADR